MLQSDAYLFMQKLHGAPNRNTVERTRIEENLRLHRDGRADWLPFLCAVRQGETARCKKLYESGRAHPLHNQAVPYAILVLAQLRGGTQATQDNTRAMVAWLWEMHVRVQKEACPWHKIRQKRMRLRRLVWGSVMEEPAWRLPAAREVSILRRWLEWAQLGCNQVMTDDLQQRLNAAEQRMQAESF